MGTEFLCGTMQMFWKEWDASTTLGIYLMPLNCTLKNS